MKKIGALLVPAIVLAICANATASESDWLWNLQLSASPGNASVNGGKIGVLTTAVDGQDSADVQTDKSNKLKLGVYHSDWVKSKGNDDPYWSSDIRGTLPPGQVKKWSGLSIWKQTSAGSSPYVLLWVPDSTYAPVRSINEKTYRYYLTVVATQPVAGAAVIGTEYEMIPGSSGSLTLPSNGYGSSAGYGFEFTAVPVIPEPSGILVGVATLGLPILSQIGRLRRRSR